MVNQLKIDIKPSLNQINSSNQLNHELKYFKKHWIE